MSRRLNLGLMAFVVLVALATGYAVWRKAAIPDPASCVGRLADTIREDGIGAKTVKCRGGR